MTGIRINGKGLAFTPGLLFAALFIAACQPNDDSDATGGDLCYSDITPISNVQGEEYHSPLQGTEQRVAGAVTHAEAGSGYFIEEPGDGRPTRASRALFVEWHPEAEGIQPGQHVVVGGRVEERGERRDKLTSLVAVGQFAVCESSLPTPLTQVQLPLSNKEREALEGMRVAMAQDLFVDDVYAHYRGRLTLAAGSPMRQPTEDREPGKAAERLAEENRQRALRVMQEDIRSTLLAAGSRLDLVVGGMGHDGRDQLLLLESRQDRQFQEPEPLPAPAPGALRVVNANLLNYFNGNGRGGGFPNERGAESQRELDRQERRLSAAMAQMKPDLLAVQELENDGYGRYSAAQSLVDILDEGNSGPFAVVDRPENRLGTDVITVGLFYRESALERVGPSHTLDSAPFRNLSRQPLAQVFRDRSSGESFLVVVNHLKSKGSCPDSGPNQRQRDGQGCWNPARVEAVEALLPWAATIAEESGTGRILVLGDMNAYRKEDPIRAFRSGGYSELVEKMSGLPQHSYRFFGQAGTLDYAFASPAMAGNVESATIWHINSDWPARMDLPQPWLRMSDHDPVVVDVRFTGDR